MAPKLTFVVPSYNMEKWLPVTLESCLAQTEQDIEVLVINDGSTDRTLEIAKTYANEDSRVRVISQQNLGLGPTRAVGQREATGEYITWLDADDFLDKDAAKEMLAVAYRDSVDMVCGNAVVFSEKTFNTRSYFYLPAVSNTTFANPNYWKCKVVWRWIIKTQFLREAGVHHPAFKLGQDVCTMYQALTQVSRFSQCPHHFYYFRQDHKRTSSALELEVEHQIRHFQEVKAILMQAQAIKPLVKYLNENLFRDIKKLAPRMVGADAVWRERCIEYCFDIFDGLNAEWFRNTFLAPELKEQNAFLPLVDALIAKDIQAVSQQFDYWMEQGLQKKAPNKESPFHTVRRHFKAILLPRSIKTRLLLRGLERAAQKRLRRSGII
ncbi:glycosyltransferase family 2 protein [Oleidesulfovibrio sp.]|uniref:glycosyltransferase family 2 protein n=1 Tax=Oleidesulfovibrio sp. TaxID=2909707 RepID=UPI003A8A9385